MGYSEDQGYRVLGDIEDIQNIELNLDPLINSIIPPDPVPSISLIPLNSRSHFKTSNVNGFRAVSRAQTSSLPSGAAELRAGHSPEAVLRGGFEMASNTNVTIKVSLRGATERSDEAIFSVDNRIASLPTVARNDTCQIIKDVCIKIL